MKKTLTINLGGIVYHIDDDAYRLLDNYLSNLKHYFRKQEGAEEIVNDIEMRIAELFAEKVTEGKQVITVSDVEEIIARVGKPEDFGIADEDMDSQKRTEQTSSANQGSTQTAAQRRWFRDPDNKLLGGVAAGLAAYFGWDITLVRILMIILLVALVILCCPVLFVLAVVLVALVFAAIAVAVSGGALLYEMLPAIDWMPVASVSPMMTLLGTIAGVALIGIPLGAFLYTILRQLFHWSPMGTGLKWSLLILWILGAVIMIINLSALGWQLPLYGLHCS